MEKTEIYKKAYRVAVKLIDENLKNLRYMSNAIPGIYSTFWNYGIPQTDETLKALMDCIYNTVCELYFGGCEPTFASEESYNWWHKLSRDDFEENTKYDYMLQKHVVDTGSLELKTYFQGAIFED